MGHLCLVALAVSTSISFYLWQDRKFLKNNIGWFALKYLTSEMSYLDDQKKESLILFLRVASDTTQPEGVRNMAVCGVEKILKGDDA